MIKKIIYHFIFILILTFSLKLFVDKVEGLNPVMKAIGDIRFSDLYFSINEKKSTNDIYIVDLGLESPVNTRKDITEFIKRINSEFKPKVIGVDVYFDKKYIKDSINSELINQLSSDNVIRLFKVDEKLRYPDFSFLPGLKIDENLTEGYSFGLGKPTEHPCVRYYKPTYEIDNIKYNHISKLIAEKYIATSNKQINQDINFNNKMMINYNINFINNRININDTSRYAELKDKIVLLGINTYNTDGYPMYNEDIHYTPKNKSYIGRSIKDSYGIEILATITSNIINNEFLAYKPNFVKWLNYILSILTYVIMLYLFINLNESFIFIKIISQTFGVIILVLISVSVIEFSNFYIDLSSAIAAMFISAEIVEIIEELLPKVSLQINKLSKRINFK